MEEKLIKKALFLDRDGVINHEKGFVHTKENFIFQEGIFELVTKANSNGYHVIIITNQSGIARGYFTEKKFLNLMNWMMHQFKAKGCVISKFYYCPFHPNAKIISYKKNSYFRKPSPGMIINAKKEFSLNLKESLLIGDRITDIEAGNNAGIGKCFLFSSNEDYNHESGLKFKRINSLSEVSKIL